VFRKALWNQEAAQAMDELVERFSPDVVHAHKLYPQLSPAPIVVARRKRVPVVQTIHDYEFVSANPLNDSGGRVDRDEDRLSFRILNTATFMARRRIHVPRVSRWIAVSEAVAATHRPYGIHPVVLRNFALRDADAPPSSDRTGIAYVGRLTREKGADVVVDLARRLPGTKVTVAGMGTETAVIEAAAAELPNLKFVGQLSSGDVARLLERSRVAVMPSRWAEPGPLVALEAMAAGTPIVAFDSGGLGEYVRLSGSGFAVPPETEALFAGCKKLLEDSACWQRASDAARAAIDSLFSPAAYVERLESIYEAAARDLP
jgi:glycosyltransferase involved in cell wall biosynthesis